MGKKSADLSYARHFKKQHIRTLFLYLFKSSDEYFINKVHKRIDIWTIDNSSS